MVRPLSLRNSNRLGAFGLRKKRRLFLPSRVTMRGGGTGSFVSVMAGAGSALASSASSGLPIGGCCVATASVPAAASIRFGLDQPGVRSLVVGSLAAGRLAENVAAAG